MKGERGNGKAPVKQWWMIGSIKIHVIFMLKSDFAAIIKTIPHFYKYNRTQYSIIKWERKLWAIDITDI